MVCRQYRAVLFLSLAPLPLPTVAITSRHSHLHRPRRSLQQLRGGESESPEDGPSHVPHSGSALNDNVNVNANANDNSTCETASKLPVGSVWRSVWRVVLAYIGIGMVAFHRDMLNIAVYFPTLKLNLSTQMLDTMVQVGKWLLLAEILRRSLETMDTFRKGGKIHNTNDKHQLQLKQMKSTSTTTNTSLADGEYQDNKPSHSHKTLLTMSLLVLLLATSLVVAVPLLYQKTRFLCSHPLLVPIVTSILFRALRNFHSTTGSPNQVFPEGVLGFLRTRILQSSKHDWAVHQAHIPQLEQHYTFEQINERYYRDWAAWRKAFPNNHLVPPIKPATELGTVTTSMERTTINDNDADDEYRSKVNKHLPFVLSSLQYLSLLFPPVIVKNDDMQKKYRPSLAESYPQEYTNGTVIILDMTKLDGQASRMESIRDQISFILHLVENEDSSFFSNSNQTVVEEIDSYRVTNPPSPPKVEIIALLESSGGSVSSYGLASSHLQRLRSTSGIQLTICIDTVAASGGYMMACMASPGQLYCAPFALVGSIGVIGQSINIHNTLEKFGVRPHVFRGGKMKNPMGMVGEVTPEGMGAMQDLVDRIHGAFREHVARAREEPLMEALEPPASVGCSYFPLGGHGGEEKKSPWGVMEAIDQVATGDVFLGIQAIKLGLVDRLVTSDEYIAERIRQKARVLKLIVNPRPVTLSSLLMGHHQPSPFRRNPPLASTISDRLLGFVRSIVSLIL